MNKGLIQCILGGAMGCVLAVNGITFLTWGFRVVILLALAMRLVGDE